MTSIMRAPKQTPSNFFWSHGADLWSLDVIKAVFNNVSGVPAPEYRGSMILFDTEAHFTEATYQLLNNTLRTYYAEGYTTCIDMGKNIYIGVAGGESKMLTMSLVKNQGADLHVGYGLTAMNVSEYTWIYYDENIELDLIRACI
jgi:hypothetical protein